MTQYVCMIQEGGPADARRDVLEARIQTHHEATYAGERVGFRWIAIAPGRMFTEGQQSTSSVVSSFIEHETTFAEREAYLRGICDVWSDVTGCTDHEIVATVTETVPAATSSADTTTSTTTE